MWATTAMPQDHTNEIDSYTNEINHTLDDNSDADPAPGYMLGDNSDAARPSNPLVPALLLPDRDNETYRRSCEESGSFFRYEEGDDFGSHHCMFERKRTCR
jgi:hypothetical protein